MFWVQVDHFVIIVIVASFVIHSLEKAEANYKRKLMEDFGKLKAKFKTIKQVYIVGSVRKTRHFSSREVIVAKEDKGQQENAFPTRK
ncbi:hypothetical protein NC651_003534 [Populus alba x Populus x berolinensis]|nr:hypothetical protein NC651_003534 [Populus alba x Populus x berolinensis]